MDDVQELYQEMIIDHSRSPRNSREIPDAGRSAEGYNPLCGDRVRVFVEMDGDIVRDIAFQGSGCAISTASASLMTEAVKGMDTTAASELIGRFHDLVTGESRGGGGDIGKLRVFGGVRNFPARVKCAVLAWHALRRALAGDVGTVSTE